MVPPRPLPVPAVWGPCPIERSTPTTFRCGIREIGDIARERPPFVHQQSRSTQHRDTYPRRSSPCLGTQRSNSSRVVIPAEMSVSMAAASSSLAAAPPGPPTSFELRIPPTLIQAAKDKHKWKQSELDWHQCDVVDCGRWYQKSRQARGDAGVYRPGTIPDLADFCARCVDRA